LGLGTRGRVHAGGRWTTIAGGNKGKYGKSWELGEGVYVEVGGGGELFSRSSRGFESFKFFLFRNFECKV